MYPTNPVASNGQAVVLQANIFGGVDEIHISPPKASKATRPGPAPLHDAPAPPAKVVKPVKPESVNKPKPTLIVPAQTLPAANELLVDPDEPISVDLEGENRENGKNRALSPVTDS